MLAWPPLCGADRLEREYAACRKRLRDESTEEAYAAVLAEVLASALLGMPPGDWLRLGHAEWEAWRNGSSMLGARLQRAAGEAAGALPPSLLLPAPAERWLVLEQTMREPAFCAAPLWHGEPRETGSLARRCRHAWVSPLLATGRNIEARLAARLVELAQWACGETGDARDWADAVRCGDGAGLASVETARGVLLHRVRVEGGLIVEYAAVAPTEWNFHPRGAYAREAMLIHPRGAYAREAMLIAAADDAERKARMLALSLDPCVACEVQLAAGQTCLPG